MLLMIVVVVVESSMYCWFVTRRSVVFSNIMLLVISRLVDNQLVLRFETVRHNGVRW